MRWNLKKAIIDKHGSQEDFARQIGIDPTRLSRIIRGHISPSEAEIELFSRKLDKEPAYLFTRS